MDTSLAQDLKPCTSATKKQRFFELMLYHQLDEALWTAESLKYNAKILSMPASGLGGSSLCSACSRADLGGGAS